MHSTIHPIHPIQKEAPHKMDFHDDSGDGLSLIETASMRPIMSNSRDARDKFCEERNQIFSLAHAASKTLQQSLHKNAVRDDKFEPIPIDKSRSDLQTAKLQKNLEEAIIILFDESVEPAPKPQQVASLTVSKLQRSQDQLNLSDDEEPLFNHLRNKPQSDALSQYCRLRFRPYQADQWDLMFDMLLDYKKQHGDCNVPHSFPKNSGLGRWVKRQRYQYKLKNQGKTSTMTEKRVKILERTGFVWSAHSMAWEERFRDLEKYCKEHGGCNVPTSYAPNQKLAT